MAYTSDNKSCKLQESLPQESLGDFSYKKVDLETPDEELGISGPPLTSPHVQSLSSLCPPFPNSEPTNLDEKESGSSKFYFIVYI